MSNTLMNQTPQVPQALAEKVLIGGDLSILTPGERLSYYNAVCTSLNLNPLTRPFEYLALNGKLILYARKDCTDQLRNERGVSVEISSREVIDGIFVVTAKAKDVTERTDESIGAVPMPNGTLDKANAMMKAETKAKRRVTLSICGLGMLDETEVETIDGAHPIPPPKPLASVEPPVTSGTVTTPVEQMEKDIETGASTFTNLPHINSVLADLEAAPDTAAKSHIFNEAMALPYSEVEKQLLIKAMKKTGKKP